MTLVFEKPVLHGQEWKNTCGAAVIRTDFATQIGKHYEREYLLRMELHQLYEEQNRRTYTKKEFYKILGNGTDTVHFKNIAASNKLSYIENPHSTIDDLAELMSRKIIPIVYRSFDGNDREGHYLLILGYDDQGLDVWDPSRLEHTPKHTPHEGILFRESFNDFQRKWLADDFPDERWMSYFC